MLPGILLLTGIVVYANSLAGAFVLDDDTWLPDLPQMRPCWSPQALTAVYPGSPLWGRPVVAFTMAVNYALHGHHALGFHVINIAIHLGCALLLFGLVRRTLLRPAVSDTLQAAAKPLAFASSLLWLVHPLQTECVNYISQRTESLAAFWYLLTMYCAVRAWEPRRTGRWTLAAIAACVLGIASKELTATAPALVVLYDLAFRTESWRVVWRARWRLYLGLAVTWVPLALLMVRCSRADSVGWSGGVSAFEYALNQADSLVHYLQLVFWPRTLVLDYGVPKALRLGQVWPQGLLVLALLAATAACVIARPQVGFLGVWFFVILSPTSSFIPILTEVAAERRMYLPSMAVIAGAVVAVYWVTISASSRWQRSADRLRSYPWWPKAVRGTLVLLLAVAAVLLAQRTVRRNRDYRDPLVLYQGSLDYWPGNKRALYNAAVTLRNRDQVDEAIVAYSQLLASAPEDANTNNDLGVLLARRGEFREARACYERSLADDQWWAAGQPSAAADNLAWLLATCARRELRDGPRAVELAERLCRSSPQAPADTARFLKTLAAAYTEVGRTTEADAAQQKARELGGASATSDPRSPRGHVLRRGPRPL